MTKDQMRSRLARERGYSDYGTAHDAVRQEIDRILLDVDDVTFLSEYRGE